MATFRKHEHLKSARLIEELVTKGRIVVAPPIKLIWMSATLTSKKVPAQVAFSVPKRNFPLAVDRNRIKRQLRECYRANKDSMYGFLQSSGKQYAIMILFTDRKPLPFSELMLKFTLTLQRFEKDIKKLQVADNASGEPVKQVNDSAD